MSCLFGQDAASSIFQGNVQSLSLLDLEVELATYESIWHSKNCSGVYSEASDDTITIDIFGKHGAAVNNRSDR